jgi:hypothetical protein
LNAYCECEALDRFVACDDKFSFRR